MPDEPPDDAAETPSVTPPQRTSGGAGRWVPPSPEHLQQLLPQYEVIEMLGAGGMGAVYKARQITLDRLVAIKILPPGIVDDGDANFTERFINEARTMAKLNHPAIVHVHDFGQTAEGQLYFVMEYVDGTDIAKMIQSQGKLPADYALAITAHVCDALQYAHTHGVIHRDIKPANVLLNMEGQVKVADFGLAKANDPSHESGLTKSSMTMGTPDFIAPEALTLGMTVDQRADLYAVGVMLYNMLTGKIPRGAFDPPSVKAGSDPRFDAIVLRAMKNDPAERYQTALEIRRDLDVILTVPLAKSDAASGTLPKSFAQKNIAHKPVARGPQARISSAPVGPVKKSAAGKIIAVLAVLAAIAAGAFVMMKKPASPAQKVSDDAFIREVAALPPDDQVQRVMAEMKKLNPGFDPAAAQEKHTTTDGKVTALDFRANNVTNISPLRALTALADLNCGGPSTGVPNSQRSPLSDISPLRGLPLTRLHLYRANVSDLTPLKGMRLEEFGCDINPLEDLSPLAGMPLKVLSCYQSGVTSLAPLRGMSLKNLIMDDCAVTDLSPLTGMTTLERLSMRGGPASELSPLKGMRLTTLITGGNVSDFSVLRGMPLAQISGSVDRNRDRDLLSSITSLKSINGKPAAEWLKNPTPDTAPIAASTSREVPADGSWLDVIPLVQLPRDFSQGNDPEPGVDWRVVSGVLQTGDSGYTAIISPELTLPESYDLAFRIKASLKETGSSTAVQVPVGGHHLMAFLFLRKGIGTNSLTGLEMIDGKNVEQTTQTIRPSVFRENVEQLVELSVRSQGGNASVTVKLDGKEILQWAGKEDAVSLWSDWKRTKPHRFGLSANHASITYTDVRVRRVDSGVTASPATAAPAAIGDTRTFNGHRYQLVLEKSLPWSDAKAKAEKTGGHLATITSKEEDDFVRANFCPATKATGIQGSSFWLGAIQATTASEWKWVTGEPFKFTNWGTGEPNTKPDERSPNVVAYAYGAGNYGGGYGWNDCQADGKFGGAWGWENSIGYLVEWDSAPIPDLLLKQYTDALARNRKTAPVAEQAAYDAEISRLKNDSTIPSTDAPGIPTALKNLRQILRQEAAKQK